MATFHFEVKTGSIGSAASHSSYIARRGSFRARGDLAETGHGNLPGWTHDDPSQFWRAADKFERANGAVYREFIVALPNELNQIERHDLVYELIDLLAGAKPFEYAVHIPQASLGSELNAHLHLMISDRMPDDIERPASQMFRRYNSVRPDAGGRKKDGGGMTPGQLREQLIEQRRKIALLLNEHLARHGWGARLDHRSLSQRGLSRQPERHLGPARIRGMSPAERLGYAANREPKDEVGAL